MKKLFRWKSGNGEMIGFAVCSIIIATMIVCVYAFSMNTVYSQQLSVAAYVSGRAAVVSKTPEDGKTRATEVLKSIYTDKVVSGATNNEGDVWLEIKYPDGWRKGYIAEIDVYQHVKGIFPFPERNLSWKLAMMIEDQPEDVIKK